MKITLDVRHILIPFRFSYGHAKASHSGVESIVCIARDENGNSGLGEAVPRHYVTGESCASVMEDIKTIAPDLLEAATDIDSLRTKLTELADNWKGAFPACAFCAVELALVDLITRKEGRPFYAALGSQQVDELSYSGSIGIGKKSFLIAQLLAYRAMGLKSFKLKVGSDHDLESLRSVRKILGSDVRIFADANGYWDKETAIGRIEELQSFGVWAVEEPLSRRTPHQADGRHNCEETLDADHYKNCAWLRERSPIPLIADESIISQRSLKSILEYRAFDVVNIRLSKLGGAILAADITEKAVSAGMQFYIGAMVGESAILAAAGSHFGCVYNEHLLIQGYSHGALHRNKIAKGDLHLSLGGSLKLKPSVGLGIFLEEKVLDQVTIKKELV